MTRFRKIVCLLKCTPTIIWLTPPRTLVLQGKTHPCGEIIDSQSYMEQNKSIKARFTRQEKFSVPLFMPFETPEAVKLLKPAKVVYVNYPMDLHYFSLNGFIWQHMNSFGYNWVLFMDNVHRTEKLLRFLERNKKEKTNQTLTHSFCHTNPSSWFGWNERIYIRG